MADNIDKATITWVKPNGNELETNAREETIAYCLSLGFKQKGKQKATKKASKKGAK